MTQIQKALQENESRGANEIETREKQSREASGIENERRAKKWKTRGEISVERKREEMS